MQKRNVIIGGALGILLLVASGFYWYGVRPSNIKKECGLLADAQTGNAGLRYLNETADQIYQDLYSRCLNKKGL
ncbi:MAG: hypothetical protein Q7S79_00515 [bacterium]|nr:hypothetical protein [bacterium]